MSAEPVVLPRAFLLHAGHGLRPAPGIPCAISISEGRVASNSSGVIRREKAGVRPLFES
jgi:hypothetical protein